MFIGARYSTAPGNSVLRARHRGKKLKMWLDHRVRYVAWFWSTGHFPTSKILPVLLCICRCNYYAIKPLKTTCVMPTQESVLFHYDCNWLFGLMTDVFPDFGFCQLSGYKAGFHWFSPCAAPYFLVYLFVAIPRHIGLIPMQWSTVKQR